MSKQFIIDYKEGVKKLLSNGGVEEKALFQTVNRRTKFPGDNLYYTFSAVPIRSKTGIAKLETSDRHTDIMSEIDENGNFTKSNYVTSARNYALAIQKKFDDARNKGKNLVILDQDSFLNKSLRSA